MVSFSRTLLVFGVGVLGCQENASAPYQSVEVTQFRWPAALTGLQPSPGTSSGRHLVGPAGVYDLGTEVRRISSSEGTPGADIESGFGELLKDSTGWYIALSQFGRVTACVPTRHVNPRWLASDGHRQISLVSNSEIGFVSTSCEEWTWRSLPHDTRVFRTQQLGHDDILVLYAIGAGSAVLSRFVAGVMQWTQPFDGVLTPLGGARLGNPPAFVDVNGLVNPLPLNVGESLWLACDPRGNGGVVSCKGDTETECRFVSRNREGTVLAEGGVGLAWCHHGSPVGISRGILIDLLTNTAFIADTIETGGNDLVSLASGHGQTTTLTVASEGQGLETTLDLGSDGVWRVLPSPPPTVVKPKWKLPTGLSLTIERTGCTRYFLRTESGSVLGPIDEPCVSGFPRPLPLLRQLGGPIPLFLESLGASCKLIGFRSGEPVRVACIPGLSDWPASILVHPENEGEWLAQEPGGTVWHIERFGEVVGNLGQFSGRPVFGPAGTVVLFPLEGVVLAQIAGETSNRVLFRRGAELLSADSSGRHLQSLGGGLERVVAISSSSVLFRAQQKTFLATLGRR